MFCSFSVAVFSVLAIGSAWCEASPDEKRWNFMDGPWVENESRPPIPTWPDQFISDFHLYIKKYGEDFESKGAIIYDWTKRVSEPVCCRIDYMPACMPQKFSGRVLMLRPLQ